MVFVGNGDFTGATELLALLTLTKLVDCDVFGVAVVGLPISILVSVIDLRGL